MTKIAILTDSTANLPVEQIEQYNIRVIHQKIHWGNESLLDGVDITPNEFYTRLSYSRSLPTTSQPSIQDFLQAFVNLAEGADGIFVPLISSAISGTVASAQAATRQFKRVRVEIVDTHVTSAGQALVVLAAARGTLDVSEIDETTFSHYLYCQNIPDVDLILRTGGEWRLSNFLLWRSTNAIFWCMPVLWPDFQKEHLQEAIAIYAKQTTGYNDGA